MNQCFGFECQNNGFGQNPFFGAEAPLGFGAAPLGLGFNPLGAQPGLDFMSGFPGFPSQAGFPGLQSSFPF